MTEPQMNLLGDHAQPDDRALGQVQRECMRVLRELGSLARDEAGAVAHNHSGKHPLHERCLYCGVDGARILKTLQTRRLVDRDPVTGDARLPTPEPEPDGPEEDGIPY